MAIGNLDKVLERISYMDVFNGITRYQYTNYTMEDAMEIVKAIGRKKSPRFVIDDENRFVYENFIRWCHCDTEMKCLHPETREIIPGNLKRGLYIAGNTGSGKSWCLDIMTAYCMAWGFQICIGGADREKRNLCWLNHRADAICDEYIAKGYVNMYKNAEIIGIQDLGAEPSESMYMGNRINVLRQILEYRGDKPDTITFITSNIPMGHAELVKRYDDRVASRLCEMCNYLELRGKDRRKI